MNHSDGTLTDPQLLHSTLRHDLGRTMQFYMVPIPAQRARPPKVPLPVPRYRLLILSTEASQRSRLPRLLLEFSAEETRKLEVALAQALGTRRVRKDARPPTRLTRSQARTLRP